MFGSGGHGSWVAGIHQSGSGLSRMSFSVSCGTYSLKSPDRIADTKKPRRLTEALLIQNVMSHTTMATYTNNNAHLFIEKQARYEHFLQLSSHYRDR